MQNSFLRAVSFLIVFAVLIVFQFPIRSSAQEFYHSRPKSSLSWHACDRGFPGSDCALLDVPLDYSHPNLGTIRIGISRIKAENPAQRIGTLFLNAGGPGADGDEGLVLAGIGFQDDDLDPYVRHNIEKLAPLREHFDLIGFDPRGVGRGTRLSCPVEMRKPQMPFPPITEKDFNSLLAFNYAYGKACEQSVGPLINHVHTLNVVEDIEDIRKALGESTISYYGASYGTEIGQLYAEKYPTHLRAIVLDSNVNHSEQNISQVIRQDVSSEEKTLMEFDHFCHKLPHCQTAGEDFIHNLDFRLRAAQDGKLSTISGTKIPPENITEVLRMSLDHASIPQNSLEIGTILRKSDKVYRYLSQHTPYNDFGTPNEFYSQVVDCHDLMALSSTPSYAQYSAVINQLKSLAPHMWRSSNLLEMTIGCYNWPISPQDPPAPLHISAKLPVLLLHNHADPETAPIFSITLHRKILGSRLIITNAIGHGADLNSGCGTYAIVQYLLTARLPMHDRYCSD